MDILVTGSAGHLGEALMRKLRADQRAAIGVDIKSSPYTDHVGSICDRAFIKRCMQGVGTIIHTATLHKPHIATHNKQDFADTNVSGTLVMLEEAVAAGVKAFIFTSTTSTFGSALIPAAGEPAAWVTEDVVPVMKNIYGTTKLAAENLCELFFRQHRLPAIVLRTSRFFPEADDDPTVREQFEIANLQAIEMLHRRVDIEDVVAAHLLALDRAPNIGFRRYIISATTPFTLTDLTMLRQDAPEVTRRMFPECAGLFASPGWALPGSIDRVYVNQRARTELDWRPKYDFQHVLDSLGLDRDFRSPLAIAIGSKGYHDAVFDDGPYPIA